MKNLHYKIISDTHFGHFNILLHEPSRIQKARIEGYEDFDEFLIEWLNEYLEDKDEILHLGDVAFKEGYKLAEKLKGNITLIKGNHDKNQYLEYYKSIGWKVINSIEIEIHFDKSHLEHIKSKYDKKILLETACLVKDINGKRIFFSHYPVFNDNSFDKKFKNISKLLQEIFSFCNCDVNIHGHTHSYCVNDKRCINACLEVNDFIPLKI